MMNFKTLSLIGAMLVSTTGVGVAQAPTPTPLNSTICCPQNVSLVTGTCLPNTDCYLVCNSSSCQAVSSAENANWAINFQKAFNNPVHLGQPETIKVINKSPLILNCIYKDNITLVYANGILPNISSYNINSSGCIEVTNTEDSEGQRKKHTHDSEK